MEVKKLINYCTRSTKKKNQYDVSPLSTIKTKQNLLEKFIKQLLILKYMRGRGVAWLTF